MISILMERSEEIYIFHFFSQFISQLMNEFCVHSFKEVCLGTSDYFQNSTYSAKYSRSTKNCTYKLEYLLTLKNLVWKIWFLIEYSLLRDALEFIFSINISTCSTQTEHSVGSKIKLLVIFLLPVADMNGKFDVIFFAFYCRCV